MGARRSRAEWEAIVRAFEQSGEALGAFCSKRRIRPGTLTWWRWRLGAPARATGPQRRTGDDVRLVPVDIIVPASTAARPTALVIAVSDVEVRVEVGTDPSYVGALVAALRS